MGPLEQARRDDDVEESECIDCAHGILELFEIMQGMRLVCKWEKEHKQRWNPLDEKHELFASPHESDPLNDALISSSQLGSNNPGTGGNRRGSISAPRSSSAIPEGPNTDG